jgi:hypothetical protein
MQPVPFTFLLLVLLLPAVKAGQIKVCVKSGDLPISGATVNCWDDDYNSDDFMAQGTTLVNGCVTMSYQTKSTSWWNCAAWWDACVAPSYKNPDIHCEISAQCIKPQWTYTKNNHDQNKLADFGTQYVTYDQNYCGDVSWNGCGAASFPDWLSDIADSVSGFQNQCNLHDVCYGDCSKSRSFCDNNFLSDMYAECSGDFFCEVLADIFFTAVDVGGESACRAGRDGCTLSQQNLCDL